MLNKKYYETLKIIYNTYEKFTNGGESYFEIDGKTLYTDTGYAIEGIEYFIQELQDEMKKSSIFNN